MKSTYILASALALATTAPAFAQERNDMQTTPFTGPYVGVYGGYDWSEAETAGVDPEPDGWEGGVFAGYKVDALMGNMSNYGIGANSAIEAFYGISNSDDTLGGIRAEKKQEWGVSFRPGLSMFDRMMGDSGIAPYAILGYRNTEFETTTNGSEWYNGFELGIGTELIAYGNAGIRLEYAHTWYNDENGVDPDSDGVRLGLSYHF